jgi:hypothetical protein
MLLRENPEMSLYLVKESRDSEKVDVYRLGSPTKEADGTIIGYTSCSQIADYEGKTFASTNIWIPASLIVRKYGEASAQEAQEAAEYNTALDELLEIEAAKERARKEWEETH